MTNPVNDAMGPSSLEGHIVPRSFIAGYIVISYFVSLIGAWTTLELINRRTGNRGFYNWFLLAASSVTMGGIAIWSMHFIGNRAIILGDGHPQLQIVYSIGFTLMSFFLPIVVLYIAFYTVGSMDTVNKTRVILGGTLAGLAILGMHYLGQAGVLNYECVYIIPFVIAAAIIAIVSCIAALSLFFLVRLHWDTYWWRRIIIAIVLASAVTSVHWVASAGTQYRLKRAGSSLGRSISEYSAVVAVIAFSVGGCIVLLGSAFFAQRRTFLFARRAQQFVLATAMFDYDNRLLVTSDGFLPARKITDSWVEQSLDDAFCNSHHVFLWMFRVTYGWKSVADLIPRMQDRVHRAGPENRLSSRSGNSLLNSRGGPVEDYSLLIRERFCVAAADLANSLHQPLDKMGHLYKEITPTGNGSTKNFTAKDIDIENSGAGKGQLLFLVRMVNGREAEDLQAAGFRFATPSTVIPALAKTLQVKPQALTSRIDELSKYAAWDHMLNPGLHLAIFGIRAALGRGGPGRYGFDILARDDAKSQLPTMQLPFDTLENWQLDYLKTIDSTSMASMMKILNTACQPSNPSQNEQKFARDLLRAIEALREESDMPILDEALLIAEPIKARCRGVSVDSPPGTATLITFRIVIPIQVRALGRKLFYVPLNLFKMRQLVYKNSPDHDIFAQQIYREFLPILGLEGEEPNTPSTIGSFRLNFALAFGGSGNKRRNGEEEKPETTQFLTPTPSRARTCSRISRAESGASANDTSEAYLGSASPHEGNLVVVNSEGSTHAIDRQYTGISPRTTHVAKSSSVDASQQVEDLPTYIDEMFRITMAKR